MKTMCAWCGSVMRDGDDPVSHGICPPCAAVVMAEMDGADAANIGPGGENNGNGERVNAT